jgi:hypothetical protein
MSRAILVAIIATALVLSGLVIDAGWFQSGNDLHRFCDGPTAQVKVCRSFVGRLISAQAPRASP